MVWYNSSDSHSSISGSGDGGSSNSDRSSSSSGASSHQCSQTGTKSVFPDSELSHISEQKSVVEGYLQESKCRAEQTRDFLLTMREKAMKSRDQMMAAAKENQGVPEGDVLKGV